MTKNNKTTEDKLKEFDEMFGEFETDFNDNSQEAIINGQCMEVRFIGKAKMERKLKDFISQAIKQAEKRMLKKAIKSLPEEVEVGFEAPPDPLERWRDTPDKECLKHCDETYNYCIKRMKKNLNSLKEQ